MTKPVFILLATALLPNAGLGQPVELHIRLDRSGWFTDRTIRKSQKFASDMLASAGVRAVWLGPKHPALAEISIKVVNKPPAGMDLRTLGYTISARHSAAVVASAVKAVASRLLLDEAVLLAVSIAHEAGHLLGIRTHADQGIMAAELSQSQYLMAAQGSLKFTLDE